MSKYVRLCKGLNDKGVLIKPENLEAAIQDYDLDHYVSVYYYNETQYKQFQKTNSIRGISDVVTDKLVFDFDSKNNLEEARSDALRAVERLNNYGISADNIEMFFSGSKGFTVQTKLPKLVTPEQLQSIAINKIGKGLNTLDPSLYNASRILRVPGTKHNDTGLYKIPLSSVELKTLKIDQIKELAKESFVSDPVPVSKPNADLFEETKVVETPEPLFKTSIILDLSNKSPQWKDYKWALFQGHFESGERHNAMMVIAATCRGLGYDADTTFYMCKAAAEKQAARTKSKPFDEDELRDNIIEKSVFSPHWEGGQFAYKNSPWLQAYCKRMNLIPKEEGNNIVTVNEAYDLFTNYANNIDKNTITTGIVQLDKRLRMTVGMSVGIVAPPGVGKTSLALQILNNMSLEKKRSMFFSFDMFHSLVIQKLVQKHFCITDEELFSRFRHGDKKFQNEVREMLEREYGHVSFCFTPGMNPTDMQNTIKEAEDKHGEKIGFAVSDYNELIMSEYSDPTQSSAYVAQKVREIANVQQVCFVNLYQPSKMTGGPSDELTSYRGIKGSSAIEQSCGIILGMSRPGFDPKIPEEDKFLNLKCLKNRMGSLFSLDFKWDGLTGTISEMTEEEWGLLKNVRERRKKEKEGDGW